jgi:tellurite resistance protein
MDDRELTEALAGLGLDRKNHRAVGLLPLVEVAWADGKVQRAERELILEIAERYGVAPGDAWLKRWLEKRPTPTTFLAARTVLLALMARSGKSDVKAPDTLDNLLELCVGVAEAAGGLFGLAFTYEQSERDCIEEIARTLARGPTLPDVVVRAWSTPPAPGSAPGIGDQVTVVRRIAKRKARTAKPTAPPPNLDVDLTTARLTRPRPDAAPKAGPLATGGPAFQEEEPTVPYFDDLKVLGGTYLLEDEDEDDEGG